MNNKGQIAQALTIIIIVIGFIGVLWVLPQILNFGGFDEDLEFDEDGFDDIEENLEGFGEEMQDRINFAPLITIAVFVLIVIIGIIIFKKIVL